MVGIRKFKSFLSNREGNIAVILAIISLPLILSAGAMYDYTESFKMKSKMTSAMDAAMISAGSEVIKNVDLDNEAAVKNSFTPIFNKFFQTNMVITGRYRPRENPTVTYNKDTRELTVSRGYDYRTAFLGIVRQNTIPIVVRASAKLEKIIPKSSLSIMLVLDNSSYMVPGGKINIMKLAVQDMINNFRIKDPNYKYIRIGAVAYTGQATTAGIAWYRPHIVNWVNMMNAKERTSYIGAGVEKGVTYLASPIEESLHQARNGGHVKRIMVILTGSQNWALHMTCFFNHCWDRKPPGHHAGSDRSTRTICTDAKNNKKIEIYAIAFLAKITGEKMMEECATDPAHYFKVDTGTQLREALSKVGHEDTKEKLTILK